MTCMFKVICYFSLIYLKNFAKNSLKHMNMILITFYQHQDLAGKYVRKRLKQKQDFLIDIAVLQMVEQGIGDEIWYAIHRYAKANNKYKKYYNKNKELSYLIYSEANKL